MGAVSVATSDAPRDRGLLGLGLLMQAVGGVWLALMGGFLLLGLVDGSSRGGNLVWLIVLTGLGAWASVVLWQAGRSVGAREGGVVGKIRTYAVVSWAQLAIAAWFFHQEGGMPLEVVVFSFGLPFAVWPTLLFLVSSLEPYRGLLDDGVPETSDRGLEGLSIYMTLFGAISLLLSLLLVYAIVTSRLTREWQGLVILLCLILLGVRAGIHVAAGLKGAVKQAWDSLLDRAGLYGGMGVGVAVAVGFLITIIILGERRKTVGMFIPVGMLVAALLVWPLVVRRFVADRGPAASLAPAPDRGLGALGWLLLSAGCFTVVYTLGALLLGRRATGGLFGPTMPGIFGSPAADQALTLLSAGLASAAGLSLVRMTPAFKATTLAYAGVATLLGLVTFVKMVDVFSFAMRGPTGVLLIGVLAMSLVVPVGSGLLVLRRSGPTT